MEMRGLDLGTDLWVLLYHYYKIHPVGLVICRLWYKTDEPSSSQFHSSKTIGSP